MVDMGRWMRRASAQRMMNGVLMASVLCTTPMVAFATDDEAQRALITGHGLLDRGLHELAAAEYESYLEHAPNGPDVATARYGLAVCRFRMEQWQASIDALNSVPRDASFAFAGDALLIGGHALLRVGDAAGAAERFGALVKDFPYHTSAGEAAAVLVEALQRAGKNESASRAFEELTNTWPNEALTARAAFFAGQADLARDDAAQAADRFGLCAKSADEHLAARATLMQGRCLERTGDAAGAQRAFSEARAALANEPALRREATLGEARLLYADGELDLAARALDAALEGGADDELGAHTALLRARVHLDQDEPVQAAELLAPLARSGPRALRDDAAYWAAKCALRADKPESAATLLAHASQTYPASELIAEMRYDLGIAYTRASQAEQAEAAFGAFVEAHPKHALAGEALTTIASLQHNRAAYDESLATCQQALAVKQRSASRTQELQSLRAENLLMLGRHDDAAKAFALVENNTSDTITSQRAAFRGAQALTRAGRFGEARPLFERVIDGTQTPKEFVPAALELGGGLFEAEDYAGAAQALELFVTLAPDDPAVDDALIKLGLAQSRQEHLQDALATFKRVVNDHPDSRHASHARFEMAQALAALDRMEDATAAFEAVVKTDENSRFAPYAMRDLGALAQQRGDYEAARRWFERAAATGVEAVAGESRFEYARSMLAAGRYDEAAPAFEELLNEGDDAQRAESHAQLGLALSRLGRCDEAVPHLQKVLSKENSLSPSMHESTMYEYAWCLRELKRPEAVAAYRELLDMNPAANIRGHALLDCAALLMDTDELVEANTMLEAAISVSKSSEGTLPQSVTEQIVYRHGVCCYKLGQHEQAAATLDGFNTRFPDSTVRASATLVRGESLLKLNQHAGAADMFAQASRDDTCRPQDMQAALLRLGETSATLQRWDDSRDAFGRYLAQFGDESLWFQAAFGVAWAHEQNGTFDDAIAGYRTVVTKHEGDTAARAQFQIGQCLFAQGELRQAVRELLRVDILYAYPQWSAAALHEAGKCFEQLNQVADARAQYEAVVERFGDSSWAELSRDRLANLEQLTPPGRPVRAGGE